MSAAPRVAVVTFGCRVNQADSLAMERRLLGAGAVSAPPGEADLVIVNTCSVTAAADQAARQTIRRVSRANPAVRIVVTGCYATRRSEDVRGLPNVVQVIPNAGKDTIPAALSPAVAPELTTADRYAGGDGACGEVWAPGSGGRTAITLRVQTGCDQACSYCIIPRTRGAGRSQPLASVLADIGRAIDAGYKEVVITGVHLGSYGRDLGDGTSLAALVRCLAERPEDVLFRISSLEPMDCTPEIVAAVAGSPRLAPHFHLPLQHGADRMLRAMRRPYTVASYARLVHSIRSRMPQAAIGADLIVGFPGESAADFEEMRRVVSDLPLTHLHVFPYSDRPGTEAEALPGKVEPAAVRERGEILRAIGQQLAAAFRASQIGAGMRALTIDDGLSAVTPNYLKVRLDRRCARNEWVDVTITGDRPLTASVAP